MKLLVKLPWVFVVIWTCNSFKDQLNVCVLKFHFSFHNSKKVCIQKKIYIYIYISMRTPSQSCSNFAEEKTEKFDFNSEGLLRQESKEHKRYSQGEKRKIDEGMSAEYKHAFEKLQNDLKKSRPAKREERVRLPLTLKAETNPFENWKFFETFDRKTAGSLILSEDVGLRPQPE